MTNAAANKVLRVKTDTENRVESRLVKTPYRFIVGIYDVDENEAMSELFCFPLSDFKNANALFDRISS